MQKLEDFFMNKVRKCPNWLAYVVTTMTMILACFMSLQSSFAAEVKVSGASANDAIVTTKNGENVTGKDDLNKYIYYNVTYHWSLPENTMVKNGDTAVFELPNNVSIRVADTTFDVTDDAGHVVGNFKIAKGSHTGVLTFNDYFEKNNIIDIHGTLVITASGTRENDPSQWFLNKSGWLDSEKRPNWTVVFNPKSLDLTNVNLKDELQGKQTLDVSSLELWYGSVDENNQFVAKRKVTNPVEQGLLKVTDNTITAHFDRLDEAIQLVYRSQSTDTTNLNLVNVVTGSADELGENTITATIALGGEGTADGTEKPSTPDQKPEQPNKPDCPHRPCKPHHGHHHGCRPGHHHHHGCHRPCRPQRPCHKPSHHAPCHKPQRPHCGQHCGRH